MVATRCCGAGRSQADGCSAVRRRRRRPGRARSARTSRRADCGVSARRRAPVATGGGCGAPACRRSSTTPTTTACPRPSGIRSSRRRTRRHWLMVGNRAIRLQAANDGTVGAVRRGRRPALADGARPGRHRHLARRRRRTALGHATTRSAPARRRRVRTFGPTWFEVRDAPRRAHARAHDPLPRGRGALGARARAARARAARAGARAPCATSSAGRCGRAS